MKFGIDYFPDGGPDRISARRYFEDAPELAEHADGLGYDSVKINRSSWPASSRCWMRSAAAASTWAWPALRRLWTGQRVTFDGRFHRFRDVTVLPRPTQTPHPPIWIAAVVSPESFVRAGEQGYNMMVVPYLGEHRELAEKLALYRQAYRDHGHEASRGPGEVLMVLHLYVASTMKEAREECRPYMKHYLRNFRASARSWTGRQSGQSPTSGCWTSGGRAGASSCSPATSCPASGEGLRPPR